MFDRHTADDCYASLSMMLRDAARDALAICLLIRVEARERC